MQSMRSWLARSWSMRAALALALVAALLAIDGATRVGAPASGQAVWPIAAEAAPPGHWRLEQRGAIPMPEASAAAHASFLLAMPADQQSLLTAFWFAGSREGAADVQIAASSLDRSTGLWSRARFVVNAEVLGRQLGFALRRLGNPVAWIDARGQVHLFVVATGMGGWAASRIVHLRQSSQVAGSDVLEFEPVRVLPLSWLWNTSFLVRGAPLPLSDGGMILPAYFELGAKYPVALRFDAEGAFAGLVRISRRQHLLQPSLVMLTPRHWLALMRDAGAQGHVAAAASLDAGDHWQDLADLALTNPDASIAALALRPGQMVLVHNPTAQGRSVLDLSSSADGEHWRAEQTLERGAAFDEYSYPSIALADGSLWVSYTDRRQRVAWQRFAYKPD